MSERLPPQLGCLYHEAEAWDAYDEQDQDLRRARWLAIMTGWVLGQDDMVGKLIAPLTLAELIDLDASLTSLRYEVRHALAKLDAPWTKRTRPELSQD
jgi:hypothetical protein